METMELKKIETNNTNELYDSLSVIIEKTKILVDKTCEMFFSTDINKLNSITLSDLGIRDRKRLKRILNKCILSPSINSYNRLLHFISIKFFPNDKKLKLIQPQHDIIQKKRKIWLGYKELADRALADYKTEKGDFYK